MNIRLYLSWMICCFVSMSINAQQNTRNAAPTNTKKRSTVANILVQLDKTPGTNSRNNGRSNKSRCCKDEIAAPTDYQVLAFGLSTQWYLWETGEGDQDIPNPIPYLSEISNSWNVGLYRENGIYLLDKSGYISDNELMISIDGLADGQYYIEIEHDGSTFHTGFRIGKGSTSTPIKSKQNNIRKNNR